MSYIHRNFIISFFFHIRYCVIFMMKTNNTISHSICWTRFKTVPIIYNLNMQCSITVSISTVIFHVQRFQFILTFYALCKKMTLIFVKIKKNPENISPFKIVNNFFNVDFSFLGLTSKREIFLETIDNNLST